MVLVGRARDSPFPDEALGALRLPSWVPVYRVLLSSAGTEFSSVGCFVSMPVPVCAAERFGFLISLFGLAPVFAACFLAVSDSGLGSVEHCEYARAPTPAPPANPPNAKSWRRE